MQPRITSLDQAASIKPFGIDMKLMLGGEHTGGTFSAVVAEVKPGEGPPPHMHHDREGGLYVLEGTYKLSVAGNETTIGPNTLVFVPRNTVHAFSFQQYRQHAGPGARMDHPRQQQRLLSGS